MATTLSCLLLLPLVFVLVPPETPDSEPGRVPTLLTRARTQLTRGEKAEALGLIDEALRLDQESGWARALRGMFDDGLGIQFPAVDRAVARRLVERTISVDHEDARLDAVLDDLEQRAGIDVFADWPALDKIGIHPDERVTLKAEEITTARFLDELVKLVGDRPRARWRIRGGQVTVSAPEALRERRQWTVVYDVRDVARADDEAAEREAVNRLIHQLRANVDPDGWSNRGGDRNWLRELRGNLIITSTPWNHRAIESMLLELRRDRARAELLPGLR